MADAIPLWGQFPAEAVNPANNERVAAAEQVEQSAPLRSLAELGAHAGYSTVRDDLVELKARLLGLGSLVVDGLFGAAYASVLDCGHRQSSRVRWLPTGLLDPERPSMTTSRAGASLELAHLSKPSENGGFRLDRGGAHRLPTGEHEGVPVSSMFTGYRPIRVATARPRPPARHLA